ncbi:uncharacterized protein LOC144345239 [Saccoglossus kowalevskii]
MSMNANLQTAKESMCVSAVAEANPSLDANLACSLNYASWTKLLDDHPDKKLIEKLLTWIKEGVPIGYQGQRPQTPLLSKNWNSALNAKAAITKKHLDEVAKGYKAGPMPEPPSSSFVSSPLGARPKKNSGKYRIIHDLSWPPGQSINDGICKEQYTYTYTSTATVIEHILRSGKGSLLAKVDLEDGFYQIPVRPADWELLGCSWELDIDRSGQSKTYYFYSKVLPFGLRSSPSLFNTFADAMQYIMRKHFAVTNVEHYLDDYITVG